MFEWLQDRYGVDSATMKWLLISGIGIGLVCTQQLTGDIGTQSSFMCKRLFDRRHFCMISPQCELGSKSYLGSNPNPVSPYIILTLYKSNDHFQVPQTTPLVFTLLEYDSGVDGRDKVDIQQLARRLRWQWYAWRMCDPGLWSCSSWGMDRQCLPLDDLVLGLCL